MRRSPRRPVARGAVGTGTRRTEAEDLPRRFRPPVGMSIHMLWQCETGRTLTEQAGLPVRQAESAGLHRLTVRVLDAPAGRRAVRVGRDAARPVVGSWRHRLAIRWRRTSRGTRSRRAPGRRPMWNGGARASMRPHATLTVDNIVDRGSDTLAYLAASGTFVPARLVAACKAAAGCRRGDGADAGAMIRPTGWRSDGSGAAHVSLRLQVLGGLPSTEEVSYSMVTECSSRCRVRR